MSNVTPLMAGMALGGVVISALGAATAYYTEKKMPSRKGVMRDFIIGAVMVAMIMQLLPESSTSLVQSFVGMMPAAPALASMLPPLLSSAGAGDVAGAAAVTEDLEVQVGPPRF